MGSISNVLVSGFDSMCIFLPFLKWFAVYCCLVLGTAVALLFIPFVLFCPSFFLFSYVRARARDCMCARKIRLAYSFHHETRALAITTLSSIDITLNCCAICTFHSLWFFLLPLHSSAPTSVVVALSTPIH